MSGLKVQLQLWADTFICLWNIFSTELMIQMFNCWKYSVPYGSIGRRPRETMHKFMNWPYISTVRLSIPGRIQMKNVSLVKQTLNLWCSMGFAAWSKFYLKCGVSFKWLIAFIKHFKNIKDTNLYVDVNFVYNMFYIYNALPVIYSLMWFWVF